MSAPRTLVVCCFFPEASRIDETVRALGPHADLMLMPIGDAAPPASLLPHLVTTRFPELGDVLRPVKKWLTVKAVLERLDLEAYDWFFFPDDDLEYAENFWPRFVEILERHDVAVAQPALTPDSYMTWEVCQQVEAATLRLTNFVEIMAPCFRRDALTTLLPTIDAETSPMGYGFDLHWGFACEQAGLRMGIVDATPMSHRFRPVGTHYGGDDLHGQGYAYGQRFPRLLAHEVCVRDTITDDS